ncbi:MAG TPA: hypothetical protein VG713_08615 [Pirellulales bacterium]|nr:hypothetical protein [Pirellulales bacterium]
MVEAKSDRRPAGDGLQQAKEYAEILGLKFAYATNGTEIIEHDGFTAQEKLVDRFPTPGELWSRYQIGQGLSQAVANAVLVPFFHQPGKEPRLTSESRSSEPSKPSPAAGSVLCMSWPTYQLKTRFRVK